MKTLDMDDVTPPEDSGARRPRPTRGRGSGSSPNIKGLLLTGGSLAIAILTLMVLFATGNLGVANIADDQVAVKMNYLTGEREVIDRPGFKIYFPFVQKVFPLDRTPQKFLMEGKVTRSENHAPFLTVRASDGSNFWFESLEIQYQIIPELADFILDDSGPGDGFKRDWMRAHARSILRDEFGKISAVEVANPSSYEAAGVRAKERMNQILRDHGIFVRQLITPKPRFDKDYESAIEEKKVADQKVDHLKVKEEQLLQQREQQLAQVSKEKEIEWQELQGELTKALLNAQRDAIRITKAADAYKVTREAEGQQERDRFTADARGLVAKYTKEAEGIRARATALEKKGSVIVREALIEKLRTVRFTLVPYSRDPAPQRLEHEGGGPTARLSGERTPEDL